MRHLKRIDAAIARIEGWLIVIFLGLMVCLTFLQVILRALFTHAHVQWANTIMGQFDWTEPFVRLLVLWLTFLGASLLTGDKKHIKIDLMSAVLPSKWQPFREVIISTACVLIMALMVKASFGYVRIEMSFGSPMFLSIPTWVGQLIMPVGFTLLLFRFFLQGLDRSVALVRRERT